MYLDDYEKTLKREYLLQYVNCNFNHQQAIFESLNTLSFKKLYNHDQHI
jgi:hypothetical protein